MLRETQRQYLIAENKSQDECGVAAISSIAGAALPAMIHNALIEQQHRGQSAAGMAFELNGDIEVRKDIGLVNEALPARMVKDLPQAIHTAIGHVRYSTVAVEGEENERRASHPYFREAGKYKIAIGKNGHLNNIYELLDAAGRDPRAVLTDTEGMTELIADTIDAGASPEEAFAEVLPQLEGAFSIVGLVCGNGTKPGGKLVVARDGHGFRPLALGRRHGDGWAVTSESGALVSAGASLIREILPGEMATVENGNLFSKQIIEQHISSLCLMEYIYLARPDTRLRGPNSPEVKAIRVELGRMLAKVAPVEADMVFGVPDSGIPAAEGYSAVSGLPQKQGSVKNSYVGRTFITTGQDLRAFKARLKQRFLECDVSGKRVVMVDDSVVRGTTTLAMVEMLREAGAIEVHMRVSSPPYRFPCHMGLDTGTRDQLIAAQFDDVNDIRKELGLDSLAYLPLNKVLKAVVKLNKKFGVSLESMVGCCTNKAGACTACFTGEYTTPVPEHQISL